MGFSPRSPISTRPSREDRVNFTGFGPFTSISGATIAFLGDSGGGSAIYESQAGVLTRVVGTGDVLGGRTVTSVDLGSSALDGSTLGFLADFSDNSSGVFIFSVPEPSSKILLASGLGALVLFGRRLQNRRG